MPSKCFDFSLDGLPYFHSHHHAHTHTHTHAHSVNHEQSHHESVSNMNPVVNGQDNDAKEMKTVEEIDFFNKKVELLFVGNDDTDCKRTP